jgi:O-methyltransferase
MNLSLQSIGELQNIKDKVLAVSGVEGDCIEVGVWDGYSANEIASSTSKKVWIVDPWKDFILHQKDSPYILGMFFNNEGKNNHVYGNVVEMFKGRNMEIVRGYFPECATKEMEDTKYSFAHIDTDGYGSTLGSLEFLYPRMSGGGIFVIHDYIHTMVSVKEAVDDFLKDKPEKPVINESQAIIIKL